MNSEFETIDLSNTQTNSNGKVVSSSISGVVFDEQKKTTASFSHTQSGPIIKFAIKKGWAKDEKTANVILIIFVVMVFSLSVFLFINASKKEGSSSDKQGNELFSSQLP
jgi:hypothetical protein